MDDASLIFKYFDNLTELQKNQLSALGSLYQEWNKKINVISRKDLDHLNVRHVLHSLAIARIITFKPGTKILDVGTGGGFPGIPLAILFPDSKFHLVDSIGKKIKVVQAVIQSIGLNNATAEQIRAEEVNDTFDFVVSRAVARMTPFYTWVKNKFTSNSFNDLENGILLLKGGDLQEEINELKKPCQSFNLKDHYSEEFFESKKLIYVAN
jgi:16S rRNA (guanine527-N7)-methyltransferase